MSCINPGLEVILALLAIVAVVGLLFWFANKADRARWKRILEENARKQSVWIEGPDGWIEFRKVSSDGSTPSGRGE